MTPRTLKSTLKFEVTALNPNGDWLIEVIDEGGANVNIEWAKLIVGYE